MFRSIGDWAVKRTIKVQMGRLRLAISADENGLDGVRDKIASDVVGSLVDIFVKDHDILENTLKEFFPEEQLYGYAHDMIKDGAIAKYGALAVWKAVGIIE